MLPAMEAPARQGNGDNLSRLYRQESKGGSEVAEEMQKEEEMWGKRLGCCSALTEGGLSEPPFYNQGNLRP